MKKLALLVSLVFFSVTAFAQSGKKAVLVIAERDFQDDELARPMEALKAAGVQVTVASTTLKEVKGMNGAKAHPDKLLKDVKAGDYDAVVFIGGSGALQYLDDRTAHSLAQSAVAQKKVLGAICLAPVILANAGVLSGKKATCYPTEAESLRQEMVIYTGAGVEREGLIITADGPKSAKEFGEELVKALGGS
jgi:protease I